jgi:hypothetical protein
MFLGIQGNTYEPTSSPVDVCADDTNFYTVNTTTLLRAYNQNTLSNTLTVNATSSSAATGIALISSASAIVTCTTANLLFVNLTGGNVSSVTTNAAATQLTTAMQQVAANPVTKFGIATKSTTGSVTLINGNTFALSSLSVTGLTSQNATCVIAKTDSSNFFIGTTDSKVYEIDTSGTVIKSLTLPVLPKMGGALSSLQVGSLSYYNGLLLTLDTGGVLRLYDWTGGPTLLDTSICNTWNLNQHTMLSNSASGTCYLTAPRATSLSNQMITEVYFAKGEIVMQANWAGLPASSVIRGCCLSPNTGKLAVLSTNSNSQFAMKVLNVTSPGTTSVMTRIQEPATLDVPGRIIRFRDAGIGRSCVDLDVTISAGATSIPCGADMNYVELSMLTSPNKWDIREFKS